MTCRWHVRAAPDRAAARRQTARRGRGQRKTLRISGCKGEQRPGFPGKSGVNRPCAGASITSLKSKRRLPGRFKDGKLTSRTRLFIVEPLPPSLQRPGHRGAGAEPRRALSPVSLAQEKPGRRRRRRRKSHGLRIRGFRNSRECLLAFDCSSSSNRSILFDLRYGGFG